jgi:hypothetical protein
MRESGVARTDLRRRLRPLVAQAKAYRVIYAAALDPHLVSWNAVLHELIGDETADDVTLQTAFMTVRADRNDPGLLVRHNHMN